MWIVWKHLCNKGKFLFMKSEVGFYDTSAGEIVGVSLVICVMLCQLLRTQER